MRDKRPVDELSIEELERILAVRKREARMQQMERMRRDGRVVVDPRRPAAPPPAEAVVAEPAPAPSPVAVPSQPPPPVSISAPPAAETEPRFEDDEDLAPVRPRPKTPASRQKQRQWTNRLLLLVEIAAVAGLALIGFNLLQAIGVLERETEVAQRVAEEQRLASIPTPAPTPTIRWENIVLPTGHIYSETGIVEFNLNEIPQHLRPVVQTQILQPVLDRPEPTEETAYRIVIPKIGVDDLIVPGVDIEALRLGVGQLINGVTPNDAEGNVVLAAHNDIYGEIFRDLDQLAAGDRFTIHTQIQPHEYVIAAIEVVDPDEVWVMENQPGRAMVTLISCYPYQQNTQRIVVFADRVS